MRLHHKPLQPTDLLIFMYAAWRNAVRLMDTANGHIERREYVDALNPLIIAFEEIGKAALCTGMNSRTGDDQEWVTFWKRAFDHTSKLNAFLNLTLQQARKISNEEERTKSVALVEAQRPIFADTLREFREKSLYSDFTDKLHCPMDISIAETVSRNLLSSGIFMAQALSQNTFGRHPAINHALEKLFSNQAGGEQRAALTQFRQSILKWGHEHFFQQLLREIREGRPITPLIIELLNEAAAIPYVERD